MASFRTIAAVTAVTSAVILATVSSTSAQSLRPTQAVAVPQSAQAFARCPKSADQFVDVMRHLVASAARARVLADGGDARFHEALKFFSSQGRPGAYAQRRSVNVLPPRVM